jgi:hypothetical protein
VVLPTRPAKGIDGGLTANPLRSDLKLATPDGVSNQRTQLTIIAAIGGNQLSELFAKARVFARELGQVNFTRVIGKLKRALKCALTFLPVVRGHVALSIA